MLQFKSFWAGLVASKYCSLVFHLSSTQQHCSLSNIMRVIPLRGGCSCIVACAEVFQVSGPPGVWDCPPPNLSYDVSDWCITFSVFNAIGLELPTIFSVWLPQHQIELDLDCHVWHHSDWRISRMTCFGVLGCLLYGYDYGSKLSLVMDTYVSLALA